MSTIASGENNYIKERKKRYHLSIQVTPCRNNDKVGWSI